MMRPMALLFAAAIEAAGRGGSGTAAKPTAKA
jgi:hypothetical protein